MPFKSDTYLRRAEREDLDTVVGWMEDPDFLRFLYGDPARSPRQIRENIVAMLGRSAGQTMPQGIYFLIDSDKYGPVGLVSLQSLSWRNRSCSVDVYIGRKELRNSFMTAISYYRVLEYCFDELNLHRVGAYIYAFNTNSWRIMEYSGAKREMVLRNHVARDGQLYDMYCYGMLRPEYEEMRKKNGRQFANSLAEMIEARRAASAQAESAT